ncbi:MAG: hypothetical protein OEY93_08345 [Anaerolineae bacterium]|nr:hypothetical protein [Anaerolineae bacterium]
MTNLEYQTIFFYVSAVIFGLGFITFVLGIFVLTVRSFGRDMRTMTAKTSLIAQKGLSDDLPGLVGNASALMSSLQQMVKTAAGIGTLLMIVGMGLMTAGIFVFRFAFETLGG